MATLSDRLYDAEMNMKLIQQRMITREGKLDHVRLSLLEEHQEMLAKALQAIIERIR